MCPYGRHQSAIRRSRTAVVEEKEALTQSPKGGRAKFVGPGRTLRNIVGETRAHVVNEQI